MTIRAVLLTAALVFVLAYAWGHALRPPHVHLVPGRAIAPEVCERHGYPIIGSQHGHALTVRCSDGSSATITTTP